MAISSSDAISSILKVWYKDGVENLLIRDSSALKEIPMTRVEGKVQNFAALYSRGGAVSSNFLVAQQRAAENVGNAEFSVAPGQLFSVFTYNAKEVQASLSKKGAYMKVAGNKAFAATAAFRQTLAASFYGRGYGEIGIWAAGGSLTENTVFDMELTEDAVAKIDIGSVLVARSTTAGEALVKLVVNEINGTTVSVTPDKTVTISANSVIAIDNVTDSEWEKVNGERTGPAMPLGLDAWLPIVNGRQGTAWKNYIGVSFCAQNRSRMPDRMAGAFYVPTSEEKKSLTVQKLLRKVRRAGSNADLIIMNDEDFFDLTQEIESTNTYFTATSTKSAKKANIGVESISASFSTNFIETFIDDPFCPKGKFYILDRRAVEYFVYTDADKVLNDGISGNEPGKQDVEALENAGMEDQPYKLMIDDLLTVRDGTPTTGGPAVEVTLNFLGSLAVINPSMCGVGLFYNANGYNGVLGYQA